MEQEYYEGHIVDIGGRSVYPGRIVVSDGRIMSVTRLNAVPGGAPFYLPGLTDAHIHLESSMMLPENFARVAVTHGVVNAFCDPHEIANVLGVEGIDFMIGHGQNVRFNFYFGLPSCVPSSHLESAGASIDAAMTRKLIYRDDIYFLSEMMNYPGVISGDREVLEKIAAAREAGKSIDGHCPGLSGADLDRYISAGIGTDHECYALEEAVEKISRGMKVMIREGSAARNLEALYPLIPLYPDMTMLCSDDLHPDDLVSGHIDSMVRFAVRKGVPVWDVLMAACITPLRHYGTGDGIICAGAPATFIAVDNLSDFNVLETVIGGHKVYDRNIGVIDASFRTGDSHSAIKNVFNARMVSADDLRVDITEGTANVIVAQDGEIVTLRERMDVSRLGSGEIQKIVVCNRYQAGYPQVGFVRGFGLSEGAFGSTVAHDSHNIVAVGCSDEAIAAVINTLVRARGGLAVHRGGVTELLSLPVAGLMTESRAEEISLRYRSLDRLVKECGCRMRSPFITLSFMALPVIKEIKLTDRGLVDVDSFDFIDLIEK